MSAATSKHLEETRANWGVDHTWKPRMDRTNQLQGDKHFQFPTRLLDRINSP